MKKIMWTVLIAFVLASVPVGGTAFAGQGHGKQVQAAKNGKHQKKAKKHKKARKHAKAAKHGRKNA